MDWKPIETAPKDGTPILACWAGCQYDPAVMHCEDDLFGFLTKDVGFILPSEFVGQPTHWMPLPRAPTSPDTSVSDPAA